MSVLRSWRLNRLLVLVAAGVMALGIGIPAARAQTDPKTTFDTLFGEQVRVASGTTDTKDDVELAARIIEAASNDKDPAEVRAYLFEKAMDLAIADATGSDLISTGLDSLARCVADPVQSQARVLTVADRLFNASRGEARKSLGQIYAAKLIDAGDECIDQNTPEQALAHYRKAGMVASTITATDLVTQVKDKLRAAADYASAQKRIDMCRSRLAQKSDDLPVAKDLAMLLVIEREQHEEALRVAQSIGDKDMAQAIKCAIEDPAKLNDTEALQAGDWLTEAAARATPTHKCQTLSRAKAAYQRFIDTHSGEDLTKVRVQNALAKIDKALAGPGAASPGSTGASTGGTAASPTGSTPSPKSATPNANATPVSGLVYCVADWSGEVRLNGKNLVSSYGLSLGSKKASLKKGDILTARVHNYASAKAFWFLFLADQQEKSIVSNTNDWYIYTPPATALWWQFTPGPGDGRAQLIPGQYQQMIAVIKGIGGWKDVPGQSIWGQPMHKTCYLYHVVK